MYYIISLKHTHKEDTFITLWRPNNSGYCYAKDQAGIYETIQKGYHDMSDDSMPISEKTANELFIKAKTDSVGTLKYCIPNCKAVLEFLDLKMTKRGLVKRDPQTAL